MGLCKHAEGGYGHEEHIEPPAGLDLEQCSLAWMFTETTELWSVSTVDCCKDLEVYNLGTPTSRVSLDEF